jgi:hypothetical protein
MDNQELFDKKIMESLRDHDWSSAPQPNWDLMQKRMAAADEDVAHTFDQLIKQKLENTKTPSPQPQWEEFLPKVQQAISAGRHSRSLRLLEGTLVCMLLLTAINFKNQCLSHYRSNPNKSDQIERRDASQQFVPGPLYLAPKSSQGIALLNPTTNSGFEPRMSEFDTDFNYHFSTNTALIKNSRPKNEAWNPDLAEKERVEAFGYIKDNPMAAAEIASHQEATIQGDEIVSEGLWIDDLPQMEQFRIGHIPHNPSKDKLKNLQWAHPYEKWRWALTAGFLINQNLVISPFDVVYNTSGYETTSTDLGISAIFSLENRKYAVSGGFRYKPKSYAPKIINETFGSLTNNYTSVSLQKIEHNIVEIPLSVRKIIPLGLGFTGYVGVIGGMNIIATSKYTGAEVQNNEVATSINIPTADLQGSKLFEKAFSPGLLQNGKLVDNFYVAAGLEVGLDYKINAGYAFSVGSAYTRHLLGDGVGPNRDLQNELSIAVGIKKYLN